MKNNSSFSSLVLSVLLLLFNVVQNYSTDLSYQILHYSRIAYEDRQVIESWSCVEHCSIVEAVQTQVFEDEGNLGYISYSPAMDAIVVAFRGSDHDDPIDDWLTNLAYFRTNFPSCNSCKVHTGFYNASIRLRELVRPKIQSLRQVYPGAKLIMTGHSLGGALATMQALDNVEFGNKVDYVYTFGSPRVGNRQFSIYYNQKVPNTFRIVNYGDLVTHVPPMSFGYHHVGNQIWYNPRGMISYDICVSQQSSCANSLSFWSFSFTDHRIYKYLQMPSEGQHRLSSLQNSRKSRKIISQARMEIMEEQKVQQAIQKLMQQGQSQNQNAPLSP